MSLDSGRNSLQAKLGSKWKPPYQSLSTPLPLQASVQKVTQTQSLGFKKVTNSSQGIEKAIQDVSGPSQPSLNGNNEKEREESGKGGGINGGKIHEVPTPKLASPPPHIDADSHEGKSHWTFYWGFFFIPFFPKPIAKAMLSLCYIQCYNNFKFWLATQVFLQIFTTDFEGWLLLIATVLLYHFVSSWSKKFGIK